ncbi:MAG: DUF11 domain-containing protein, partial [Rudanella sp.]|nr:DUF11 domain-containing protein [Rudanella sp.]
MNYVCRLSRSLNCWGIALLLFGLISTSFAQTITGTVFRDVNADGAYSAIPASGTYAYGEPGLAGVEVRVFNAAGANVTDGSVQLSSATGSYTITPSAAGPYRVEFTIPASLNSFFSGAVGSGSKTSVQFVAPAPATASFGVNYPRDYCQSSPSLLVPCFVSGDPLATGSTVANEKAIVSVPYTAINSTPTPIGLASMLQVGSVWGSVYQRSSQKLFSSAFLKRHSGLGRLGLGGIYVTNVTSSPSSATYVNLETVGINLGTSTLGTRTLPASGLVSSSDPAAFSLVGKVGLGDMALSDDESKLFVVDLFNRQLLVLNIGNPAKASLTAADLQTIAIPAPNCTDGVARPFGITVYRGKAYVGVVCTGENNVNTPLTNLNAYVYEMNVATLTFTPTPIITIPLNYTKGYVHSTYPILGNTWNAWSDNFADFRTNNVAAFAVRTALAQALLSDITFTDNGDMVLGLMDRAGHQLGYKQRRPNDNSANPTLYSGYIGGDILRARFDGTQWNLESNGQVSSPASGTLSGSGVGNGQGPDGGEFYGEDDYPNDNATAIHQETFQGGMAVVPGTNQMVATVMDPINVFSGGFSWFNNTNGNSDKRYQIYVSNTAGDVTLGKANGLGIISIACNPAPIQIGNRIWNDLNNNGTQDAGEPALAGIPVVLKGPGLPPAGTTVTSGTNGEYYFSNATGTNTTGFVFSLTGLTSGGSYSLTFPTSASAGVFTLSTRPDSATGTNADAIDTDPNAAGIVRFTLGLAGQNNFSFDAAYTYASIPMLDLDKQVSLSKARVGDLLTYTVRLANNNPVAASNVVVQDVMSSGLIYIANSATVTAGSFTPGMQGGTWAIASLPGNTTATLTYVASVATDGLVYNTATIPGDEAKVCTSIPIQVCKGSPIAFQLDAPAGFTRYQWYLTTVNGTTLVSDVTSNTANAVPANSYTATRPGEYQVITDEGVSGSCPDLSCCPVVIEEVEIPPFTAQIRNPTCAGNTPQPNGQITLAGLGANSSLYSFRVSTGSTFDANLVTVGGIVPANGVITTMLPAGKHTIRVKFTQGSLDCYRDLTVTLPSACGC